VSESREPELATLRRFAEDLAKRRGERPHTGHLLAALVGRPGPAAELLLERRLTSDVLTKATRVVIDDASEAFGRAIQKAKELAGRYAAPEATSMHLLFALCQDRACAAHRTLVQCGADVTKLRMAAMQLAAGIAPPRRTSNDPAHRTSPPRPMRPAHGRDTRASEIRPVARPATTTITTPMATPAATPTVAPTSTPTRTPTAVPRSPSPSPSPGTSHRAAMQAKKKPKPAAPRAERFALDPKKFPTLTQLGKNLTLAAARGELDPVVGRDEEIERTLDVLAKRHANNPCLVGVAGVGKTSVVRGVALRIAEGQDVASLDDRILIEIEPTTLLAGTAVRGSLAERIAQLKAEVARSAGRVVIFFDELHTLFGEAGDEAASELKLALARGELPCIGATTIEEYRRAIDSDAALSRRFTPIEVVELGREEAFLALERICPAFEKHHGVSYSQEALATAVSWSLRYMPGRALPDKALSIVDLAGARARRRGLRDVGPPQIAEVVSELAGVPVERLLESDGERMLRLEALVAERVVGHTRAIERIAAVLRRNASGFRSRRPIGSFLLLGPTGVGKTETAKAIAECLFHSPDAMTRLDLSEYAESHAIARLIGAPPGYVGFEAGGHLTESVRRRPYQVILLDEIEKAHRDVLEAFLQVFDEGRMTDGRGRTIDFSNTVIVLTSNLGVEAAAANASRARIGFGARRSHEEEEAAHEAAIVAAARAGLPPELFNRFDEVLAYAPLGRGDVAEVARRMLVSLGNELEAQRGVKLDVSEAAIDALLDAGGFDATMGARPMRRAIGRLIEAPIAEMILRGQLRRGDVATVDVEGGRIVVDAVTPDARVA
jgi:ATP-dependent Clp protease ATP-binding subunit ClpC